MIFSRVHSKSIFREFSMIDNQQKIITTVFEGKRTPTDIDKKLHKIKHHRERSVDSNDETIIVLRGNHIQKVVKRQRHSLENAIDVSGKLLDSSNIDKGPPENNFFHGLLG